MTEVPELTDEARMKQAESICATITEGINATVITTIEKHEPDLAYFIGAVYNTVTEEHREKVKPQVHRLVVIGLVQELLKQISEMELASLQEYVSLPTSDLEPGPVIDPPNA